MIFFSISIEKSKFEIKMTFENEIKYSLNLDFNDSKTKVNTFHSFDLSTYINIDNYIFSGTQILFNNLSNKETKCDLIEYIEFDLDNILIEHHILLKDKKYYIQEHIDFCNDFLIKRTQYNELLEKLSCSFFWLNDNKEGLDILYKFSKNKYIEHNSYFPEGFDNLSKIVIDYLYET